MPHDALQHNSHGQVWLNVASSHEVLPEYANLDNSIFYRLSPLLPLLRPKGTLHVIVPSLSVIARDYVDGRSNADGFLDATILSSLRKPSWTFKTLEFLGYDGLKHRWMYDEVSIRARVAGAGFQPMSLAALPSRDVRAEDGPRSIHVAARKPPLGNSSLPS